MKEFYGVNDVQKITGVGQTRAYEIIKKLKELFEKEHPESITIKGKIPIWYFNEKVICKKENIKEDQL